jgi:iron(III) transport system permease protein
MTDVVTTFAQTFDVGRAVPLVIPLLAVILVMGAVVAQPLQRALLTSSPGAPGVVRRRGSVGLSLCVAAAAAGVPLSVGGYLSAMVSPAPRGWSGVPIDGRTIVASIVEPVGCAWIAIVMALVAGYPARRSGAMPVFLWAGLILFCVPSAMYAIGWLGLGQGAGGVVIPPSVAHISRGVALAVLGFVVGYARLPRSLEDAAALVGVSPLRRAWFFIVPLVKWPVTAAAALIAALAYTDRDVAALLLAPGASRLTLNLYLASANAPSLTISVLALAVILGAIAVVALAAGPALLWSWRE